MHIKYNQKLYLMCIFVFYIMYKHCYNKNNNKVETLSILKSKNKQQEEKTMKIEEVYRKCETNYYFGPMKKMFNELALSFEEDVKKIPDSVMHNAVWNAELDMKDYDDRSLWMKFFIQDDEIKYCLDSNSEGKVQMEDTVKMLHDLLEYLSSHFGRQFFFTSYKWEIVSTRVEMWFGFLLDEKDTNYGVRSVCDEIQRALPNMKLTKELDGLKVNLCLGYQIFIL